MQPIMQTYSTRISQNIYVYKLNITQYKTGKWFTSIWWAEHNPFVQKILSSLSLSLPRKILWFMFVRSLIYNIFHRSLWNQRWCWNCVITFLFCENRLKIAASKIISLLIQRKKCFWGLKWHIWLHKRIECIILRMVIVRMEVTMNVLHGNLICFPI